MVGGVRRILFQGLPWLLHKAMNNLECMRPYLKEIKGQKEKREPNALCNPKILDGLNLGCGNNAGRKQMDLEYILSYTETKVLNKLGSMHERQLTVSH